MQKTDKPRAESIPRPASTAAELVSERTSAVADSITIDCEDVDAPPVLENDPIVSAVTVLWTGSRMTMVHNTGQRTSCLENFLMPPQRTIEGVPDQMDLYLMIDSKELVERWCNVVGWGNQNSDGLDAPVRPVWPRIGHAVQQKRNTTIDHLDDPWELRELQEGWSRGQTGYRFRSLNEGLCGRRPRQM
jgi:hypothetical protein